MEGGQEIGAKFVDQSGHAVRARSKSFPTVSKAATERWWLRHGLENRRTASLNNECCRFAGVASGPTTAPVQLASLYFHSAGVLSTSFGVRVCMFALAGVYIGRARWFGEWFRWLFSAVGFG